MSVPTQGPGLDGARHTADEVRGSSIGELLRQVTTDLSTLMR